MATRAGGRQEVNLYLAEFRHREELLNARRALLAMAAFVGLLALVQLSLGWRASALAGAQETARLELRQLEQEVAALRRQQPQTQGSMLAARVSDLERQLERSRQISRLIQGQNLGNAAGFSAQLQGMARQAPGDMQLSGFRLSHGGGLVEFAGWTREPEAVPRYIQRLRNEDSFQKVQFGNMVIERDKGKGLLRFALGDPALEGVQ